MCRLGAYSFIFFAFIKLFDGEKAARGFPRDDKA